MLLGCLWIHDVKVVPSTLYQQVKYMSNGQLIIVKGEEKLMINKPSVVPYIEATEEAYEVSFQSFKVRAIKTYD